MNTIYKIKKNRRTGRPVVVSELCNNAGKKVGTAVRLSVLCGGLALSMQALAGAVNGQYNYQDYMDFGSNLGRFTPGATNIPFYLKKNTSKTAADFTFNYSMPDFSAVDNKRIVTLVAPGYVVAASHIYYGAAEFGWPSITGHPKNFDHLLFGDTFYHQVAINRYANKDKSPDLIIPRLNKFVVEAEPVSLIPDNELSKTRDEIEHSIRDQSRFPIAVRTGTGLPRIYQARIDEQGKVSLWGVDADDPVAKSEGLLPGGETEFHAKSVRYSKLLTEQAYVQPTGGIIDLTDTGVPKNPYPTRNDLPYPLAAMPRSNTSFYFQGQIILNYPYFTNIPYIWGERGDSSSPLFFWDNDTQRWELVGLNSTGQRVLFASKVTWTVVSKSIVQPTILADINAVALNNQDAVWNKNGDIAATDGSRWAWQGIDSLPASSNPKHIKLSGGGKITLAQSLSMGAGGLIFDNDNDYTIAGQAAGVSWHGAGLDIGAGSTVQWRVDGVKKVPGSEAAGGGGEDDYLHKVGKGTLEVYTANAGGLKLGDGSVILKTADAFSNTFITSGRGTLTLDAENALDPKTLRFATGGGTLDLNGYDMAFEGQRTPERGFLLATGIRAQDYGAIISNRNADKPSTVTLDRISRAPGATPGYLYPGRFTGNLHINSSLGEPLVFNGGIDTPAGVLQRNGGELRFQGEPIIHFLSAISTIHERIKGALDANNTANQDPRFAGVKNNPGSNLPDHIVDNQQEFDERYWNSRSFTLQTINATDSPVTVARNAYLSADMNLENSPLVIGHQTVYIDRSATRSAINNLAVGESVASAAEDQARYQGNISARQNSPITMKNSQVIAAITADDTSAVTLGDADGAAHSEWRLLGDSALHSLRMLNNSALYFHSAKNGSNDAQDWVKPNTLTLANLDSSNNDFYFGINPQSMQSDKLIVTGGATGSNNTINLNMFFDSVDPTIATERQGRLLLARIPGSADDFFSTQPVNIGFSLYSPNIETAVVDDNTEWRLAIANATDIMLDTPAPSIIKPAAPVDPALSGDKLAAHDDWFNTADTAAAYEQEKADALLKEQQAKEAAEKQKMPVPTGKVGEFYVTDLSGEHGGKFMALSEDAKIYIYFSPIVSRFRYNLADGGQEHTITKLTPNSDGTFNVTYDSGQLTGLPWFARPEMGGKSEAFLAVDVATGSISRDVSRADMEKLIDNLVPEAYYPDKVYSEAKNSEYKTKIPAWALVPKPPIVDVTSSATETAPSATPGEASPPDQATEDATPSDPETVTPAPDEVSTPDKATEDATPPDAGILTPAPDEASTPDKTTEDATPPDAGTLPPTPGEASTPDQATVDATPPDAGTLPPVPGEASTPDQATEDATPSDPETVTPAPDEASTPDKATEDATPPDAGILTPAPDEASTPDKATEDATPPDAGILTPAPGEASTPDQATVDATPPDAGVLTPAPGEASTPDQATEDATPPDAGILTPAPGEASTPDKTTVDATPPDAGILTPVPGEASTPDQATVDATPPDAGILTPAPDGASTPDQIAAGTDPSDAGAAPPPAMPADDVILVPAVSFFTRTDNAPLINKVENVMQMPQVSFVMETNQLNKRLGDIRHLQEDTGGWLKPGAGVGQYGDMKLRYDNIQGGIDKKLGDHFYGLMVSRTSSNARGSGLSESHTTSGFGLYYSWVPNEGFFVDVIGKYLKNRQNLQFSNNGIAQQNPSSNMFIGSAQAGYRLQSDTGQYFMEPSIEVVVGHLSGYSMHDDNVKIDLQAGNPIYTKIGFNAGKNWQLSEQQGISVAIGLFRLQNLKRGGSLELSDRLPGQAWQVRATTPAAADNRYLGTLSVNARLSPDWRVYAQTETSFADRKHYNFNAQIGIRYQF